MSDADGRRCTYSRDGPCDTAKVPDGVASESRALKTSLVATAVLGGGAVIWGVISGSSVVLFDGIYMLAGIALVGTSMVAAHAAASPPSVEFPFGRHGATALAVALQGTALIATLTYGVADAVSVIIAGGSDADPGSVALYGVVSAALSLLVVVLLTRPARTSQLVRAELVGWRAGTLMSVMVAIGGGIALALRHHGAASAAAYVDPTLVLIASAAIAPMAVKLARQAIRELMEAAPPDELSAIIEQAAAEATEHFDLADPVIRATRLGRRLYVEIDYLVSPGVWRVEEEDQVRRFIVDRLASTEHQVWATVELSTDRSLMED